jgi:hypothetical protein
MKALNGTNGVGVGSRVSVGVSVAVGVGGTSVLVAVGGAGVKVAVGSGVAASAHPLRRNPNAAKWSHLEILIMPSVVLDPL